MYLEKLLSSQAFVTVALARDWKLDQQLIVLQN